MIYSMEYKVTITKGLTEVRKAMHTQSERGNKDRKYNKGLNRNGR